MIFRDEECERQVKIQDQQHAREMDMKREQHQHEIELKKAEEKTKQVQLQQTEHTATAGFDLEQEQCQLKKMEESRKTLQILIREGKSALDLILHLSVIFGNNYTPRKVREYMQHHSRGHPQSCAPQIGRSRVRQQRRYGIN